MVEWALLLGVVARSEVAPTLENQSSGLASPQSYTLSRNLSDSTLVRGIVPAEIVECRPRRADRQTGRTEGDGNARLHQKLFGKKSESQPTAGRISMAPDRSQEEQDSTRERMETEMDASRAARDARRVG